MKICWDNLEELEYTGNGVWRKVGTKKRCIEKTCAECGEVLLGWGHPKKWEKSIWFCDASCATTNRNKGRILLEETRKKISNSLVGDKNPNFGKRNLKHSVRMTGKGNPMFGKSHSDKVRKQISEKAKVRLSIPENNPNFGNGDNIMGNRNPNFGNGIKIRGSRNPNWRGGISFNPYCIVFNDKSWRSYIYERDEEKFCWNPQCTNQGTKECLHHINYDKKDCRYSNIIKICNVCNITANYNREWWKSFYEIIMQKKGILTKWHVPY